MLSFKEIKELIDLVAERGLSGLEVEQAGFRVRIEGLRPPSVNGNAAHAPVAVNPPGPSEPSAAPALSAAAPVEDKSIHVITSPIVGTFYRAPSPESDSFAEVGQRVSRGKILCIIESMK